jgi:N-acyl-D-amino-acid deacylase
VSEFLDVLEQDGLLFNTAFLVGHGALRYMVMGERANSSTLPTPQEMDRMRRLTRQALREGAFGCSAGLAYAPGVFAHNEELLSLLQIVAEQDGIFTAHGRAYTWVSAFYTPMIVGTPHNVRSTRELMDLARQARARLQLSHLIFVGRRTWRTHRTVLRDIEQAAADGLDVTFDTFPYTVGNTTISVVFPAWFLDGFTENVNDSRTLGKLKRELDLLRWTLGLGYDDITLLRAFVPELSNLDGLDFATIARGLGMSEFEAYIHVARESEGRARVLLGTYSGDNEREEPLQATLAHPLCTFATDTILTQHTHHNPASFGTFPRILGRYSRDLGLFSLEEAVHRMTAFSAERIGLADTGRIVEGGWGDLVIFDPATVADNTTPSQSDAPPTGIRAVLVSGQIVAQDGQIISSERHGRVLRR